MQHGPNVTKLFLAALLLSSSSTLTEASTPPERLVMPAEEYCRWQEREIWKSSSEGSLTVDWPYVIWTSDGGKRRFLVGEMDGGVARQVAKGAVNPSTPPIIYAIRSEQRLVWGSEVFVRTCE